MAFERQNKMPEGVGKRIIEALKTTKDDEIEEFSSYNSYQEPDYREYNYIQEAASSGSSSYPYEDYNSSPQQNDQKIITNKGLIDSSNINTLVELVTKLPPGVTKQTGAQIIKHTMEAMGISINKVLANAQMAQEELENSVKGNISSIEEHKMKIKMLEQEIQQFRKKARDLEDIISLFILSDKK